MTTGRSLQDLATDFRGWATSRVCRRTRVARRDAIVVNGLSLSVVRARKDRAAELRANRGTNPSENSAISTVRAGPTTHRLLVSHGGI